MILDIASFVQGIVKAIDNSLIELNGKNDKGNDVNFIPGEGGTAHNEDNDDAVDKVVDVDETCDEEGGEKNGKDDVKDSDDDDDDADKPDDATTNSGTLNIWLMFCNPIIILLSH